LIKKVQAKDNRIKKQIWKKSKRNLKARKMFQKMQKAQRLSNSNVRKVYRQNMKNKNPNQKMPRKLISLVREWYPTRLANKKTTKKTLRLKNFQEENLQNPFKGWLASFLEGVNMPTKEF